MHEIHHDEHETEERPDAGFDLRELVQLHPRLMLAAVLVALAMVPVGMFVAALGVWVLDFSGGAAKDTSIVVAIAGYLVSDFWGGGIVAALTRARAVQVAAAWTIARIPVLLLVALVLTRTAPVAPVQLLLAAFAAYAGARVARKQAALRRQIQRERTQAQRAADDASRAASRDAFDAVR